MTESMSVSDVAELLRHNDIRQEVIEEFTDNEIDGKAFILLDDDDLKNLGLKIGAKAKVRELIRQCKGGAGAQAAEPTGVQSSSPQVGKSCDVIDPERNTQQAAASGSSVAELTMCPRDQPIFTVKLNVLVSGCSWGWDESSELSISLRFPSKYVGLKENHPCQFQVVKVFEDGLIAFKGLFEISYNHVKKYGYFYYKYVVTKGAEFEHIWSIVSKWGEYSYRCIEIPAFEKKPGGVWEQWDTTVYPKEVRTEQGVKSVSDGFWDYISKKLQFPDDSMRGQIGDDPEDMEKDDERCLWAYLEQHQIALLKQGISSSSGISKLVNDVEKIWGQLLKRKFVIYTTTMEKNTLSKRSHEFSHLNLIMKKWVTLTTGQLKEEFEKSCADYNSVKGKYLVSSVTLLCIIYNTISFDQFTEKECNVMVNLMHMCYQPVEMICPAYDTLCQHIPTEAFRLGVVIPAIKGLAIAVLEKSNGRNWRWFLVLPMAHFLNNLNAPFQPVPLTHIDWNFWMELRKFRNRLSSNFHEILEHVKDLIEFDYVVMKVLLFMCPHKELGTVLQNADPILCTSFYIWYVQNYGRDYIAKAKDHEVLQQHFGSITMSHKLLSKEEWAYKYNFLKENAHSLMKSVTDVLTGTSKAHCVILFHLTKHVLCVISMGREHSSTPKACSEENITTKTVVNVIRDWMCKVIGHTKFGGAELKKFKDELRIWKRLFTESIRPQNLKEQWNEEMKLLLEKRVQKTESKTALVLQLDPNKNIPDEISEVLIRLATDDLMSPNKSKSARTSELDRLMKDSSANVGRLFSRILSRHLEDVKIDVNKLEDSLTIDDLIEWEIWPTMLKIYNGDGNSKLPEMSQSAKKACKWADHVLYNTCGHVKVGAITYGNLQKLFEESGSKKLDKLCTAARLDDFDLHKWLNNLNTVVRYVLIVRLLFYDFLKLTEEKSFQGSNTLKEQYESVNFTTMSGICSNWDTAESSDCLIFICFPAIHPLVKSIFEFFFKLAEPERNDIFRDIWKENLSDAYQTHSCLTQQDIIELVWTPTFESCCSLVYKLKDESMLLSEVEKVFCGYQLDDIQICCESLVESLASCSELNSSDVQWIQPVCRQIESYRLSQNCLESAKALLKLRERLELIGDFKDIELLKEPTMQASYSLQDITDQYMRNIQKLFKISDEKCVRCLQSLVDNWTLIKWIEEFESVNQLHAFVEVALDTSDRDVVMCTKLSSLRTVGSAVGKLLFELPKSEGFFKLVAVCDDFLEGKSLPNLLEDCSKNLAWFQKVKATHGSLEHNTIDETTEIVQRGELRIGTTTPKICETHAEVINVHISGGDEEAYTLNFEELQNLISRIVLITNKSKSDDQTRMQKLLKLFRMACEIAEILIELHKVGNMEYIGKCYHYPCDSTNTEKLSLQTREMKKALENWTELETARERYYPLNSFTNKQLCLLRQELYYPENLKTEVTCLLKALLPSLSDSDIVKTVKETWQQLFLTPTHTVAAPNARVYETPSISDPPLETFDIIEDLPQKEMQLEQLVESTLLTSSEREVYSNLTENYDTNPLLTMLVILSVSDGTQCTDGKVTDQYDDMVLETDLKERIIVQLINELLEKKSLPYKLREIEEQSIVAQSEDGNLSPSGSIMSESSVDLSLTRYEYFTLEQLGKLLQEIVNQHKIKGHIGQKRKFRGVNFETGSPNLIVTTKDLVLSCTLMIYAEDMEMPLPTQEEVLICNSRTTAEEVSLLWRRAIGDPGFRRIFCLVHAEKLSYLASEESLRTLLLLKQAQDDYRLVIICSREEDSNCHLVQNLHAYLRSTPAVKNVEQYLKMKYCNPKHSQLGAPAPAPAPLANCAGWTADIQKSCVRVVQSSRAGMGKSHFIIERANELKRLFPQVADPLVSIRVHGPRIDEERIMDKLQSLGPWSNEPLIVHFDIAPSMVKSVDCFLFSILILGCFTDQRNKLWRRSASHLYMIEVTLPLKTEKVTKYNTEDNFLVVQRLLKVLPAQQCYSPQNIISSRGLLHNRPLCTTPEKLVYHYLRQNPSITSNIPSFDPKVSVREKDFLQTVLSVYDAKDPSWRELHQAILFFSEQLSAIENSYYCANDMSGEVIPGLRSLALRMITLMSKEFTLPSLQDDIQRTSVTHKGEVSAYRWTEWHKTFHPYLFFNQDRDTFTFIGFYVTEKGDAMDPTTAETRIPKLMSQDLRRHLRQYSADMWDDYRKWTRDIQLLKLTRIIGLDPEKVKDPDPSYVLTPDNLMKMLAVVMRLRCKIPVLIMGETGCGKTSLLRFLCKLISQTLKDKDYEFKNFISMKIHGGVTEDKIIRAVEEAEDCARRNSDHIDKMRATGKSTLYLHGANLGTVLFFDEANTTDYVDLIKEIMCDHTLHGRQIHEEVRVVAACNPYRVHHQEMIKKLKSAGLGFRVKVAKERLGSIPLRHLVYRVHDLPPSMKPLVYDFGKLDDKTENSYIYQIVKNHLTTIEGNWDQLLMCNAIGKVLVTSQTYMKNAKNECSYVSLRDIDRTMIVFKFFYEKCVIFQEMDKLAKLESIQDRVSRAIVLALAVCYYARIQEIKMRNDYVRETSKAFRRPLENMDPKIFVGEINRCQEVFLKSMRATIEATGQNIAHNEALRENVMMMVVCISVRIPLFLIGKPGSSKSLAKTIIGNSMKGIASSNEFLRNFKEVQLFSYQCSQLSTSDSILNVFQQAKMIQTEAKVIQTENPDKCNFVSVVVLDEVGLAEDSPNLPLKVLHPLLEDGTEGSSYSVDVVDREDRVAFIGISNWALDPAKMNRGIMVTRCDPDEDELTASAKQICSSGAAKDQVAENLQPYFEPFAKAYLNIVKSKQEKDIRKEAFFGLRDFYSMMKMLYWMCKEADCSPNSAQISHVVLRNFSGHEGFDPLKMFWDSCRSCHVPIGHPWVEDCEDKKEVSKENASIKWRVKLRTRFEKDKQKCVKGLKWKFLRLSRKKSSDEMTEDDHFEYLFNQNLKLGIFPHPEVQESYDKDFEVYFQDIFEGKIWPLIQPDCSPAGLIKASLANKERSYHGENRYLLFLTESYAALQTLQHFFEVNYQQKHDAPTKSSSAIVQCRPPPLILFGSSFPNDKHFTQVYKNINTIKICMETGRTVILLNLDEVYDSLYDALNQYYLEYGGSRFVDLGLQTHRIKCRVHDDFKLILIAEKKVVYDRFPTPLINRLEKHIVDTSTVLNKRQKEVLEDLKSWISDFSCLKDSDSFKPCDSFIGYQPDTPSAVVYTASQLTRVSEFVSEWNMKVLVLSKFLMLKMAAPDALIRLRGTKLEEEQKELCKLYNEEQHHSSLEDFLQCYIGHKKSSLMQVTTHSHLISEAEIELLRKSGSIGLPQYIASCYLQQFDSDDNFTSKVREEYNKSNGCDVLLIVQCGSGHLNGDLIACAKYRVNDILNEEMLKQTVTPEREEPKGHFYVLFTIYIPRKHGNSKSSFVGFLGGKWTCAHIDEFFPVQPFSPVLLACGDQEIRLSELFHRLYIEPSSLETPGIKAQQIQLDNEKPKQVDPSRLYNCYTQQAVKDASLLPTGEKAKRMKKISDILLSFLQNDMQINMEFYNTLVHYVHESLVLKENNHQLKHWMYEEATSSQNLQIGGSFMAVVLRRLQRETTHVLSSIIPATDTNSNLDLLVNSSCVVVRFWLDMFKHSCISDGLLQSSNGIFAYCQNTFHCRFPFSIIFQREVEKNNTSEDLKDSQAQINIRAIEDILNSIPQICHVEMGCRYLMDLINAFFPSSLNSRTLQAKEMKIILSRLELRACQLIPEETTDFSQRVVAFHRAYHLHKNEINCFKEFVKIVPNILNDIEDAKVETSGELALESPAWRHEWKLGLDILAVDKSLERLSLDSSLEPDRKKLDSLMKKYYEVKQLIDQVLCSKRREDFHSQRLQWQKLQIVYKFIEHVVLENTEILGRLEARAKRLNERVKRLTDLKDVQTVKLLQVTLSALHRELTFNFCQKVEDSCITFYNEVISSICFGQDGPPSDKLIEALLATIFTSEQEGTETRDLTPFMKSSCDKVPVIRSFLLQLLFRSSSQSVREHIQRFFDTASQAFGPHQTTTLDSLKVLYCQCFEDSLYQKLTSFSASKRLDYVKSVLGDSFSSILDHCIQPTPEKDQQLLEAVGGLRFSLKFAAECISQNITSTTEIISASEHRLDDFLSLTKDVCSHHLLNLDNHGPRIFLFKLLFRWHGGTAIQYCTMEQSKLKWLIPKDDLKDYKALKDADPFAVHNPSYGKVRAIVTQTLRTEDLNNIKLTLRQDQDRALLTLNLFSRINLPDLHNMAILEPCIKGFGVFTKELQTVALSILDHSFCAPLPELRFSATQPMQDRAIGNLLVHIVTAILAKQDQNLLQPFVCMILETSSLKDSFLPVMPDPHIANTTIHLGGNFAECPSGHICFVHQKEKLLYRQVEKCSCPDCGKTISFSHWERQTSHAKGYTLGEPLPYQPCSIRTLSPVAAVVMRALVHAVLLWTSCNKEDDFDHLRNQNRQLEIALSKVDVRNIRRCIHPSVHEVQKFFYQHLQEDIQAIGQFLSINKDDAVLLIHLIAKSILSKPNCSGNQILLLTEKDRKSWEKDFSTEYILPVIQDVPKHTSQARVQILSDEDQGLERVYGIVYNEAKYIHSLTKGLWNYRPRLTLDHLSRSLNSCATSHRHKALVHFLREEPMIRATQYLFSILELQNYLLRYHHHRSSRNDLKNKTISDIINGTENDRKIQVKDMICCTQKAWILVKGRIYMHGFQKLQVPKECLEVTFSDDDSAELLISRPCGQGIYVYSLIAHLIYAHNEFVAKYSETVTGETSNTRSHARNWLKRSVSLKDLHQSHLIEYEDKLISMIMAHCHYSLRTGEDLTNQYDFQGLEKQFLNECVYGKPLIEVKELPHMVYRKDVYTAQKLEEIKRNVPQVALTTEIKNEILKCVKEIHHLTVVLDHIDTVLGFLAASTEAKPQTTLEEYAKHMLKIENFNELIGRSCRLQHVLSLWETVSLQLAKQLTINDVDPFHELKECFHKRLEGKEVASLDQALPNLKVDSLLSALNVFIETHLRNASEDEAEDKLVTCTELKELKFPENIKLCHVVGVWQHVVKYDQDVLEKARNKVASEE